MELDTLHIVGKLGSSSYMEELAERLAEMASACHKAGPGSKGKVTVTFEVGNDPKYSRNLVYIRESFKSAYPDRYETKGASFFVGEEGGLFDRDPLNPELPAMRAVESEEPVVRDAGQADAVRRAE